MREDVDRVRRDENDPVRIGGNHPGHDLSEDRGVALGEVQPRLPRPLAGPCGKDRDDRAGAVLVVARPDLGRARERNGMGKVHRLAFRPLPIDIDEDNLGREAREEQRVGGGRPDVSCSNDRDLTDFGDVEQATGSLTQTFTIRNTGSAALNLTTVATKLVTIAGANAADFTLVTPPAATVAAGGTTTFAIKFKPTAAGQRNG